MQAAKDKLKIRQTDKKQDWMTSEILELMGQRDGRDVH